MNALAVGGLAGLLLLPLAVLAFEAAFRASARAEFGPQSVVRSTRLPSHVVRLPKRSARTARERRFEQVRQDVPVRAA
jgi:hypothetical protein